LDVKVEFSVRGQDEYLTPSERLELARRLISQLLSTTKNQLGLNAWDMYLIVQSQSSRWMRVSMGDETEEGLDLARAKREAARAAGKAKP
jgi:hypothetical protein